MLILYFHNLAGIGTADTPLASGCQGFVEPGLSPLLYKINHSAALDELMSAKIRPFCQCV